MAELETCLCDGEGCRHHDGACTMPGKMYGWPNSEERSKAEQHEKGTPLCVACAGQAIAKGWALRSNPRAWGNR